MTFQNYYSRSPDSLLALLLLALLLLALLLLATRALATRALATPYSRLMA